MAAVLTAGERHEQLALDALMDKGAVDQPPRGGPSGMLVDRGPFHHG